MLFNKRKVITIGAILIAMLSSFLLPTTVLAHNKVVVIPMAGDDLKPLENIITVAKKNGDFNDPVAAMNSITDASDTKPYLVVIAPGVYTLNTALVIKNHVTVMGSGEKTTKLIGVIDNNRLVQMGVNSPKRMSDITIQNNGTNGIGIFFGLGGDNIKLDHVTILVGGGSGTHKGIYINQSEPIISDTTILQISSLGPVTAIHSVDSAPQIENLVIKIGNSSGGNCRGIDVDGIRVGSGNSPKIHNGTILVNRATSSSSAISFGIHISSSSPSISNTTMTISGGGFSTGIFTDNGTPSINNVTITANGANAGYGLHDTATAASNIRQSWVEGSTYGLLSSTAVVSQTSLLGGTENSSLPSTCIFSDDGGGNALSSSCQ